MLTTVQEEAWDSVTQGKHTYVIETNSDKQISEILSAARSKIGNWVYSVTDKNCEHFVKWSSGLQVSSTQVKAGVGGAVIGGAAIGMLAENPNALKILGGAALIAGIAIMASKAIEKNEDVSL